MRISDWSSDVCSSDLGVAAHLHRPHRADADLLRAAVLDVDDREAQLAESGDLAGAPPRPPAGGDGCAAAERAGGQACRAPPQAGPRLSSRVAHAPVRL